MKSIKARIILDIDGKYVGQFDSGKGFLTVTMPYCTKFRCKLALKNYITKRNRRLSNVIEEWDVR